MDLLKQTFESFNPNLMKTQVNIPNGNVDLFKSVCDRMQVEAVKIEEREVDQRFEVNDLSPSSLFYLGTSYGLDVAHRNATEILNEK